MIIAIGHRKRTGKDSFAMFLAETLRGIRGMAATNKPIAVMPQAYSLKMATHELYPKYIGRPEEYESIHPKQRDKDAVIPELGCSARDKWLDVGRLLGQYDPPIFARSVTSRIPKVALTNKPAGYTIVQDLRRLVEAAHFSDYCPTLFVRVDRIVDGQPLAIPDGGTHTLENEFANWTGWHVVIRNEATLAELHNKAGALAAMLKSADFDIENLNPHQPIVF